MPSIWKVAVCGIDPAGVRPRQLHAAMCLLLDAPPEPGTDPHKATRKDWSVSPPSGDRDLATVTVGTISDACDCILTSRCRLGSAVVIGGQEGIVVAEPALVRHLTWADVATPSGARAWRLDTLSPTALANGPRFSPLLAPEPLIGSLSRRWEASSPVPLPRIAGPQWTDLWVSDLRGTTVVTVIRHDAAPSANGKVVPGFAGSLVLQAGSRAVADIVDVLLRFAEFAGVGTCVTHGLGSVRVTPVDVGTHAGSPRLPGGRTPSGGRGAPPSVRPAGAAPRPGTPRCEPSGLPPAPVLVLRRDAGALADGVR